MTHFVVFLDCCRQAVTVGSSEAKTELLASHVCEDES